MVNVSPFLSLFAPRTARHPMLSCPLLHLNLLEKDVYNLSGTTIMNKISEFLRYSLKGVILRLAV